MNNHERSIAAPMMARLSDLLARQACSDMYLEDTPENRALVDRAQRWADPEMTDVLVTGGRVHVQDWILAAYFADQLEPPS